MLFNCHWRPLNSHLIILEWIQHHIHISIYPSHTVTFLFSNWNSDSLASFVYISQQFWALEINVMLLIVLSWSNSRQQIKTYEFNVCKSISLCNICLNSGHLFEGFRVSNHQVRGSNYLAWVFTSNLVVPKNFSVARDRTVIGLPQLIKYTFVGNDISSLASCH